MTDTAYRTYAPELEIRSAAQGGDGRTVYGIAVPYGVEQRIDRDLIEVFDRGAFGDQVMERRFGARIPFARDHQAHGGQVIGSTKLLRDDAAGLYGEWRVSATARGDETLELIKDGALDQLSVGFRDRPGGTQRRGAVLARVKSLLTEVAVVVRGAYGDGAVVTGTRGPCPTCGHVGEVREEHDETIDPALRAMAERALALSARPLALSPAARGRR